MNFRRAMSGFAAVFLLIAAVAGWASTAPRATAQNLDMNKIFRCGTVDKDSCAKARTLILDNCTSCHVFVPIVLQQFDEAGWQGLFDRHKDRIPQLDADQVKLMRSYLAANFNPQNSPPELPPDLLKQWTSY